MEEKKIIKIKLHWAVIIVLAIVLMVGTLIAICLNGNKTQIENTQANITKSNNIIDITNNITNNVTNNITNNVANNVINSNSVRKNEKNNENTVKIRYAYSYNIITADNLNKINNEEYGEDYIDILELYPDGESLEKINQLIEHTSFEKADLSGYKNSKIAIGVGGTFQVCINNDIVLLMDEDWSKYTKDDISYIMHTPEKLFKEISNIVYEKAYGSLKKYESNMITIIPEKTEGEKVVITDKNHINDILENLKYSKVNMNENEMKNEKVSYTVDLNNGTKIKVYFAGKIGYIVDNSEKYYVAFVTDFEKIISKLYKNHEEVK